MLPLFLQIDVAKLQSRVPTLDLMPTDYASFNVSLNKFDVHVRHSMPQFLQMPRPLWPDAEELVQSRPNRFSFWASYMFIKYLLALAMSVLVLSALRCPMEGTEPQALADSQRDLLTTLVVIAQLALCLKLSLTASWFGQLTASGLDFEGYDTCLTAGLLWFVAQAFSVRMMNLKSSYDPMHVALSSLSLLPFLGDPFDSLKDTMLAAVALTSRVWWVKILGGGALLYLWALHLCLLLPNKANRLELQQSYLPILSLKAPGKAKGHSKWVQILTVLYKQSTPARRWAMLLEDVPQGLLACAVSVADGFKPYILMVNIALPAARLIFAWAFHHRISWELKEWMLQEALDAVAEGKAQLSDEFTAALLRLQGQYEENLWEDVDEERWIWAKEQVKPLIAEGKNDLFQNFTVLPWMLLQLFNRDEDADGLSWDLVTVWPSMLSIIVEDSNAMKALLKLWTHRTFRIEARDSGVGDAGCRALATGISQMQHLTQLELILESKILQSNKIGQVGCESLAEGISKLRQITKLSLNLEWNEIGDHGCTSLADKISNMELIIDLKLELAGNKIGQVGCESLAGGISKLRQITKLSLNLERNEIGAHGCTSLADKISNMELITDLKLLLDDNKIGQVGCESLAEGISKLWQIANLFLDLSENEIGGDGCATLANCISKLKFITQLRLALYDNNIGKDGFRALADGLCQLQGVTHLRLEFGLEENEAAKIKSLFKAQSPSAKIYVY
ncbi:LRR and CARD domains-containing protein 3) (Nucleotide-binding oligomerization domain protein 3) [Durusdinium trenchii]|uniref:LRR and CARD domains-containing protein 3 (Nucleotide-binding oligomerization domain protein 3 n=1 Tax=Durusdinium trenchii TaxID=1381693 RepID=A0ABP0KVD1_9DINO